MRHTSNTAYHSSPVTLTCRVVWFPALQQPRACSGCAGEHAPPPCSGHTCPICVECTRSEARLCPEPTPGNPQQNQTGRPRTAQREVQVCMRKYSGSQGASLHTVKEIIKRLSGDPRGTSHRSTTADADLDRARGPKPSPILSCLLLFQLNIG